MQVTGTNPATGLTQTFNDYFPVMHRYSDTELAALWIDGTVTERGHPLPGVNVTISSSGWTSPRTVVTDLSGRYSIGSVSPGAYQVTANYTGCTFAPVSLTLTTTGGTAALSCTSSGSGIAGFGFQLDGNQTFVAYTDTNGRALQGGLTEGTFEIYSYSPDYVLADPVIAQVSTIVNVQLERLAERKVSGFVFASGTVSSGNTVTLRRLPSGPVLTTTTNAAGYYVFNDIGDGTYEVTGRTATVVYPARQVQVDRGSLLNINFGQ